MTERTTAPERPPRHAERRGIALRATLLQSVWNYDTYQGVGFAWAIAPVLERLHGDPAVRGRRLLAHLGPYNSNPYLGTIGLGVAARMEEEIARGGAAAAGAEARLGRLLHALRGSLGAVGDALFWAAWRPALGLAAVLGAILVPGPWAAVGFLLAFNALAQTVRVRGVRAGFSGGAGVARVLHDPFWRRAAAAAGILGAAAAGAAAGAGAAILAAGDGGVPGAAIFFLSVALLWLAGHFGARRRFPSPAAAFLALVILLSAIFHAQRGALPW